MVPSDANLFLAFATASALAQRTSDLVVYGGTAGGLIIAGSETREGLKVALLEPGSHLGGMATGGLSRTDFGKKEVIGGYAEEFYFRVGAKYGLARFAQALGWYYEPHGNVQNEGDTQVAVKPNQIPYPGHDSETRGNS